MDNHVLVNYVDSHCHVDRLKMNFGVNGTQDVVMALYAEVKDDRYEGCVKFGGSLDVGWSYELSNHKWPKSS